MKIAVTYEKENIFQHFGHTEQFKIYDVENDEIKSSIVVDTLGDGHGALAGFLRNMKVEVLICGGIGGGAQSALKEAGIKFFGGVKGSCDDAVKAFLNKTLDFDPDVRCTHHDHGDHDCGSHSCASH